MEILEFLLNTHVVFHDLQIITKKEIKKSNSIVAAFDKYITNYLLLPAFFTPALHRFIILEFMGIILNHRSIIK